MRLLAQLAAFAQLAGKAFQSFDQVAAGFGLQGCGNREKHDLGQGQALAEAFETVGQAVAHADFVVAAGEFALHGAADIVQHNSKRIGDRTTGAQPAGKDIQRLGQLGDKGGAVAGARDPQHQRKDRRIDHKRGDQCAQRGQPQQQN